MLLLQLMNAFFDQMKTVTAVTYMTDNLESYYFLYCASPTAGGPGEPYTIERGELVLRLTL